MMNVWWMWWMVVMFVLLVSPMGYGWGYRGWGPPYPSYIQRRRSQQAGATGRPVTFNHQSWGRGGDFVWVVFLIGVVWLATAFWWPYASR
jgi:hypothetical protein